MIDRRGFAAGLGALAAGCTRAGILDRLAAGEQGRVSEGRSGEVLRLDSGLEVRLAGIEAPNGAEPLSDQAQSVLAAIIAGGTVRLLYGGLKRDRYDRALAHVRTDRGGRWLQGEMLAKGLARVRTYPDNRALAAEMLEAEAGARRGRKGLWALADYAVLLPYECPGKSGFQIIEGQVTGVRDEGGVTSVDFLGGGARAEIPRYVASDFAAAGRGAASLPGRLARVRGVLRDGIVRLDHPETVEVLRRA